ncbi:hypothetical protein NP493_54g04044 [Ridgeia piscesae]|uniref:Uncharacterized protein n=1 Tax=Ridgeia piscesae TaxID=27915 RepID=A0AAD9PB82_RIDPI|nr:hypothetical protein NP493_54g04044 [Ridgeia piscesae]
MCSLCRPVCYCRLRSDGDELCAHSAVPSVVAGYGLTETTSVLTLPPNHRYGVTLPPATVGQPIPCTQMKVIDLTTGRPLPHLERGEICARGPQIMKGYLKNDKATRDMIDPEGWLHTGDIGYYDEDGYFFVIDRLKELMKYNSHQVVPSELEAVLLTHPDVVDAGVFGLPDPQAGELPTALVVRAPGATTTEKDIQDYVKDKVASFKRLRGGVFFVASVPRTLTGKVIRRAMRSMLSAKSHL